jgi:hypothetical protein
LDRLRAEPASPLAQVLSTPLTSMIHRGGVAADRVRLVLSAGL